MRKRDRQLIELSRRLDTLGICYEDQDALRRIEMTLHRWSEGECNGEIQRDGDDGEGAPRRYYGDMRRISSYPIADKERGALKRLAAIMSRYPALWYYHQGDPRGCALYVGRRDALPGGDAVGPIKQERFTLDAYYTRGVAVCL